MKYLRKYWAGGFLLLGISTFLFFSTRDESVDVPDNRQATERSLVEGSAPSSPADPTPSNTAKPVFQPRVMASANRSTPNISPSAFVLKHFPDAKVLEMRLEQVAPEEFRRTELIETGMKYPFVRIETRFREEGGKEVLLARDEVVANHVTVELKEQATEADLVAAIQPINGILRRKLNLEYADTYIVGLPEPTLDAVPDAINRLRQFSNIIAAVDGDGISRKALAPNDPYFPSMWHLQNTGQNDGLLDSDIDATEAWKLIRESPGVVIAISDTGVNYNHPELQGNIWANPGEVFNRDDDDGNGYRDDRRGWNFYDANNEVMDTDGHGTFVGGIIGARGNNGVGIAGISWNCQLMVLRTLDTSGGYSSDIAEGFDYARRNGARIINASHGGTGNSVMQRAVDNLEEAGVLLVAASGNYGENTDHIPLHPASYPNANIISVAASGRDDSLLSFSSYGASTVDLAAPGQGIYSLSLEGGYQRESGTSFSVPQVTGVAALLQAMYPAWDCFRVRARILSDVDRVPALSGKCVTGGRLNAYRALMPKAKLADALDGTGLSWSTSGHSTWVGGRVFTHDGVDAAETGKIWDHEETRLETVMTGPGKLSFWWKVSSEANYDFLIFYINGTERARISGQVPWAKRVFDLAGGNNTLTWRYAKDGSSNGGLDKAFLDEVVFLGLPPTIASHPVSQAAFVGEDVTFSVNANGTAPYQYQWRKDGVNIPGATRSSLKLTDVHGGNAGGYSVRVSNNAGNVVSATAVLSLCSVVLDSSTSQFDANGGNGTVDITLTGSCSWNAEKTNSWISFVSPSSGAGSATLQFSVDPNGDSRARVSFLTIGDRRFLVRQAGTAAPGEIEHRSFVMTITNATGGLPDSGSFLLTTSIGGNPSAFQITGLSGAVANDLGTFGYSKTSSTTATLALNGSTSSTFNLTFLSPTAGSFLLQDGAGTQSGLFNLRASRVDVNGDGRNDILFQNQEGVLAAWCMGGVDLLQALTLRDGRPAAPLWRATAVANLLGRDGLEIILRKTTGQLAAWSMTNGTDLAESVFLRDGVPLGSPWRVKTAADFNHDGKADLVLQSQDKRAAVWFMNGAEFLGAQQLRNGVSAGAGWNLAGVSDFDGDGENDILWQHQNGSLRVWHFVASDFVAISDLRRSGPLWRVVGIGDYNDDGKDDLLFLHSDRRMAVWFMDGTNYLGAVLLREVKPLGGTWRVIGPR